MASGFVGLCRNGRCREVEAGSGLAITASVGAKGENRPVDVRAIQEALNKVPPAEGGPNPPLAADGLVGPKTIAAISAFQKRHFGWSDGRVDPDNVTIAKLRDYQQRSSPQQAVRASSLVGRSGPPRAPAPPPLSEREGWVYAKVWAQVKQAQRWMETADRVLWKAHKYLWGDAVEGGEEAWKTTDKHFHLRNFFDRPAQRRAVMQIRFQLATMRRAGWECDAPYPHGRLRIAPPSCDNCSSKGGQSPAAMFTFYGGFTRKRPDGTPAWSQDDYLGCNIRQDGIYLCTNNLIDVESDTLCYAFVHELAHFTGPEVNRPDRVADYWYKVDGAATYQAMPAFLAMRNADTYGIFCAACGLGKDDYNPNWAPGHLLD